MPRFTLTMYPNAHANLTHTKIRYGGSYKNGYYLAMYNYGGSVALDHTEIATSTVWGFYQTSGTSTIASAEFFSASASIGIAGGTMSVSGTEVFNNDTEGIKQMGGTLEIIASHIHHNDIYGVYVQGGTADITSSVFNNNQYGFLVTGGTSGHSFHENALYDNSLYGVYNDTVNTLSATNNFWGTYLEPGSCDDEGYCSATSVDAVYAPWHQNLGRWSVRDLRLNWNGSTALTDYLTEAMFAWDSATGSMGMIPISDTSTTVDVSLSISDGDLPGYLWGYVNIYPSATDTITFDTDEINAWITENPAYAASARQWITRHELGHVLGLGHRDSNDLMRPFFSTASSTIAFGDRDVADYHHIWSTLRWAAGWFWPR